MAFTRRTSIRALADAGNDRPPLPADTSACLERVHIQRRLIVAKLEALRRILPSRKAIRLHQHWFDVGNFVDRLPLVRRQRHHIVIEVVDRHAAVVVLHGREQPRQIERRVRRPVTVIAAVEIACGAVHRDRRRHETARAEIHRGTPAGVARTVDEEQRVGFDLIAVLAQSRLEIWRASLLLAFENDADVRGQRQLRRIEGVNGAQQSDDGRLVIRRRARVHAPVGIDGPVKRLERNLYGRPARGERR